MITCTATTAEVLTRLADLRVLQVHDRPAAAAGSQKLRVDVLRAIADGSVEDPAVALATIGEGIGGAETGDTTQPQL